MIKLIARAFIKDYRNTTDRSVREAYGVLAGGLGIALNLLLFTVKLAIGLFINSIAVISDAFNNLTDSGSSMISIIGMKLSNRPPDHEHPYGHGRAEYISALAISFIILFVGLQLLRSSFDKVANPDPVLFSPTSIGILALSVLVKLWMFSYNRYIGKAIDSTVNRAVAFDSLSDVAVTTGVIVSALAATVTSLPIDGLAGVVVSFFILYTGYSTARDTVDLLLGSSPAPELVATIKATVAGGKYVVGTHGLRVHDYGPGRVIASIHAEVPETASLLEVHAVIDNLEKQIERELGVDIVIHMDPIPVDSEY